MHTSVKLLKKVIQIKFVFKTLNLLNINLALNLK